MPYADPEKQREAQRKWAAAKYATKAGRKLQKERSLAQYHKTRTNETLEAKRRQRPKAKPPSPSRMVGVQRTIEGTNAEWEAWRVAQEASGLSWTEWMREAFNDAAKFQPKH